MPRYNEPPTHAEMAAMDPISKLQDQIGDLCIASGFTDEQAIRVMDLVALIEGEIEAEREKAYWQDYERFLDETYGDNEPY